MKQLIYKIKMIIRRILFNYYMKKTKKFDYEKKVKLICKYDPLDIL